MSHIIDALKIKEIRDKLLYMAAVMLIVRIGSQIPIYGSNPQYLESILKDARFNLLDMFSGGSFSNLSIFALSVTPYITASIIIQLLTIAIPALEEMSQDGETGSQKLNDITRYTAAALALLEATGMCIGFSKQQIFTGGPLYLTLAIMTMTAGSIYLMWLGEQCTEYGIGNGTSFILLINILSRVPQMAASVYEQLIKGQTLAKGCLAAVVSIIILLGITVFVVILDGAVRNIPVLHSKKFTTSSRYINRNQQTIPLKVNTSGVIAVIFASSIMSFPSIIASFIGKTSEWGWLSYLNQNNWFSLTRPQYSLGAVVYCALVIFFAYFYTEIQFNPKLIADDLKKQGAVIPGIGQGKGTEMYLAGIMRHVIFIGAVGLLIVCLLPIIMNGVSSANVSFGGTSLIIVAGVIVEITKQVEAMLVDRGRKGFLA